jgi:hypothetical protein
LARAAHFLQTSIAKHNQEDNAMILADLLATSKTHTFDIFPPTTLHHVEKRIELRDGKTVIRCLIRDKWFTAKPEEIVRQLWLEHLHRRYGYPINRLAVEVPSHSGAALRNAPPKH